MGKGPILRPSSLIAIYLPHYSNKGWFLGEISLLDGYGKGGTDIDWTDIEGPTHT